MIAFDTNYLVRHIVQDDPLQCATVAAVLAREAEHGRSVRILDLVLIETAWVLRHVYGMDRQAWTVILESLLDDAAFSFEDPMLVRAALTGFREGKADFADYLILSQATAAGCELLTFDKKFRP
jgi:predicted nucleic-acid-binding protein